MEDIISNVAIDIIDKLEYGGSIDHARMKDIAISLGIEFNNPPDYDIETHGKALVEIKKKRNHLAHGNYSFATLGKDYTYYGATTNMEGRIIYTNLGLQHYKQFTIEHLEKFIDCVEKFIVEDKFKLVTI